MSRYFCTPCPGAEANGLCEEGEPECGCPAPWPISTWSKPHGCRVGPARGPGVAEGCSRAAGRNIFFSHSTPKLSSIHALACHVHTLCGGESAVLKLFTLLKVFPFTMNIRGRTAPAPLAQPMIVAFSLLLETRLLRALVPFLHTTFMGLYTNWKPLSSMFHI